MSNRTQELTYGFLACSLVIRFTDEWHEKGNIYLEDEQIGKLAGVAYDPRNGRYKTWKAKPAPELLNSSLVSGSLITCVSFCVGNWLMRHKQNLQFGKEA